MWHDANIITFEVDDDNDDDYDLLLRFDMFLWFYFYNEINIPGKQMTEQLNNCMPDLQHE